MNDDDNAHQPGGAIVLVAKCPIPKKSKTRLIPLLGEEGSAQFAEAMLSDVLEALSGCVSQSVVLYSFLVLITPHSPPLYLIQLLSSTVLYNIESFG